MAMLTRSHVLFASSLLALAGCAKDEAPKGQSYGSWQAAEPTTGNETASTSAERMEQPAYPPPRQYDAASAKAETTPKSEAPIQALSDGQILEIMTVVSSGEVEQAQIAQRKATDSRVEDFAKRMIKQHTQAKQRSEKLSETAQISLEDSKAAGELRDGSTEVLQELTSKEAGDEFDKLYMKGQVDQHAKVLQLLDERLIPNSTHASLKSQLQKDRSMISLHLTQARDLQDELDEREK